ncbi:T9SS type A sorting domain-containing protein [Aquimarina sp. ERC-38]|uniref:T9SS type A sorting domain-containing protein n=1 Tax=Aquimarina sp. ERC-38 TaxID=2949996 RepID=UPI002246CA63|nr:T9SS type A sorting domain-containing protein [Aquimarina sp. ERC-38]UZO81153.1 T9SS type A sorting domain-containing protein [Aquimarina sp. ERC-38]
MKLIKLFWILSFLFYLQTVSGQITNTPPPHITQLKSSTLPTVVMPAFDLDKLRKEDAINDNNLQKVYRFGYAHKTNLNIKNSGVWTTLPNGDRIWRIQIQSAGAKTLNFVFDRYILPPGAMVHVYSPDRTFILGAYTDKMNNVNNSLGTWTCDGDTLIIQYTVPASATTTGELSIGEVVHGYRTVTDFEVSTKRLGSSGNCHLDVNCDVGSDFDPVKNRLKKAVALILVNSIGWCSGSLINNTELNEAPYLLTAFHCGDGEAAWSFRFNWISTEDVCAEQGDSVSNGPDNFYQTTSGSVNLAKSPESDFRLVEITGGLDEDWDLEWVGWDRSEEPPDFTVSIHHPSGDIMKVSRDNQSPTTQAITIDNQTSQTWVVRDWDLGSTEMASSGAGLFNERGQLIGQLFGGASFCNGLTDNGEPDFYGRLNVAWGFGESPETRLSDWLDPINTNQLTLNSLSEELNDITTSPSLINEVSVLSTITRESFFIENSSDKNIKFEIYDISGKLLFESDRISSGERTSFLASSAGMYFIRVFNVLNEEDFFITKIIKF